MKAAADLDGLERRLDDKAADVGAMRARLAQAIGDGTIAAFRRAAAQALEAGQFTELDRALAEAELHAFAGSSDLATMPAERRLWAAECRADRGAACLLRISPDAYREAAQRYGEAAAIIGLAGPARSHDFALGQSLMLTRIGEDFGDASGFDGAIAQCRALLSGLDNFEETVAWAQVQERLGVALAGRADLASDPASDLASDLAMRREAAACWRAALEDLRQTQSPALWARLQRRLGLVALQLGEAAGDTELIEEAAEALRAALAATDPIQDGAEAQAEAQYALGRALSALGAQSGGLASLEAAFNAFQSALAYFTRETSPERWSDIQDRMGLVLCAMGERYREPVVFEEAIAAFGAALEQRKQDTAPLLWAASFANQGLATMKLAQRRKDASLAQRALGQILAAVEGLQAAGHKDDAAALQKKLVDAAGVAGTLGRR